MMQFIKDIISFLHTLSLIDYILYFAVLTLIVLVVTLIYLIKHNDEETVPVQKESDDFDIKAVVKKIEEKPKQIVNMTAYEEEQEEKAIISYEELLKTAPQKILYEEEQLVDDAVKVKKVDVEQLSSTQPQEKASNYSYIHEEEFLKNLKQLCELLN